MTGLKTWRAAPPPLPGPDQLDLTARQVRRDYPESAVHAVVASWVDPWVGVVYRTLCGSVLSKTQDQAILTTSDASCGVCMRGGR